MPRPPKEASPRIKEPAQVLQENPRLKTAFALRGAGYTRDEANSDTVQKRLRRYKATLVPIGVVSTTDHDTVLSPITAGTPNNEAAATATVSTQSTASDGTNRGKKQKNKQDGYKEIRSSTPSQVMAKRRNAKIVKDAEKKALKRATIMYDVEKKKNVLIPPKKARERSVKC